MANGKNPDELSGQELDNIVGGASRPLDQLTTASSADILAADTSAATDNDEPPRKTIIGGFKSMSGMH